MPVCNVHYVVYRVLWKWCGHRVFAGDGSKINLLHELLQEA
jgi:hypothetical protein